MDIYIEPIISLMMSSYRTSEQQSETSPTKNYEYVGDIDERKPYKEI